MADTVKKSRIVSEPECLPTYKEDETSLQDIINEEFNQRLKSCMQDETILEPNAEHIALTYAPGEVILKNGGQNTQVQPKITKINLNTNKTDLNEPVLKYNEEISEESNEETSTKQNGNGCQSHEQEPPSKHSTNGLNHSNDHSIDYQDLQDTLNNQKDTRDTLDTQEDIQETQELQETEDSFINKEIPSPESDIDTPFDNITVTDVDNESLTAKERFLSTLKDIDIEEEDVRTAKDRMFLSTDSACLLFTQTVVQSPMLTPTDENYDFLQALRQADANLNSSDTSPVKNEEIVASLEKLKLTSKQDDITLKSEQIREDIITSKVERNEEIIKNITSKSPSLEEKDFNSKPENQENVEPDEISEISTENLVSNQLETNNSDENISESFKYDNIEDNTDNIKGLTLTFIQNEIEGENSFNKLSNYEENQQFQRTPTIVEHLVEDIDPDNDEIIEDYGNIPQKDQPKISDTENIQEDVLEDQAENDSIVEITPVASKDQIYEKTDFNSGETDPNFDEIDPKPIESPKIQNHGDQSPTKSSRSIQKVFEIESKSEETHLAEETIINYSKTDPHTAHTELSDLKSSKTVPNFEVTDLKYSKTDPKSEEPIVKSSKTDPNFELSDLKYSKTGSKFEETTVKSSKSPPKFEETEVITSRSDPKSPTKVSEISKIFSPDATNLKEEMKSPVLEETFENIKKTKEIFERRSEDYGDLSKRLSEPTTPGSDCESDTNPVCRNNISSTITTESSFVETRTESNSNADKVLKKKKSKKSKKDNEKENISVCDITNSNDEDNLSHVSVKNLCRSFSDLTSLESKKAERKLKSRIIYGRTKSMSDIRKDDVTLENVFTNVSVKSLKSSFSKFDALQKKTVLHVRSSDSGKAQEKFNGNTQVDASSCKSCNKQVFQMEQVKAEKNIWHKNCFRCKECNKQLNVDTYQSNEGVLYCKPHFKALFTPKAVEDEPQPIRPRKHELIIRENQPEELPPDVVRASDKPDLGLEELQNLNVKERFQVFEHHEDQENNLERTPSTVNVKRSPSILSKLAKFQSKGMDIGVADDSLNGVPVEESSSEEEEEEEIEGEDAELVRAKRAQREKPMHFTNMSDVMSKWESGNQMSKEERREERKQEIQSIRSRLFMGKQAKIKEMYQQAVLSSSERQSLPALDDAEVFDQGISKNSRSIFLELDANASKAPRLQESASGNNIAKTEVRRAREAFMNRQASEDVIKASDQVDAVEVKTADISSRFKFFETYKEPSSKRKQFRITPPRDGQEKIPENLEIESETPIPSSEENHGGTSHTATRMLSVFRQMEESAGKENLPQGPKPLKRFTPPPEPQRTESGSEEEYSEDEEEEVDEEEDERRVVDEDLLEAHKAARAKHLRAKFEKWEANEIKREQNNSSVNIAEEMADADSQIESAKSLCARFESMRETSSDKERTPRVKVNRFVDTTNNVENCKSCEGRVYPLEKVSCHNNVYHKNCFRCKECNTILRMDSYTYNQGLLYCLPHFKRLFISKGNYEAGFGLDQHKEKWNTVS